METAYLNILSWNIYMLPYLGWFHSNSSRASLIGEMLRGTDHHIIVFQEAFTTRSRQILKDRLSEKYLYQYGPANDSGCVLSVNSGLWILSKFPLVELKSIRFDEARGLDQIARKGGMLLEGIFEGCKFQLLATHLQSDAYHQSVREKQYEELFCLLNEFYSPEVPQILCGDFNTEKRNKSHSESMLRQLDAEDGDLLGTIQHTYYEEKNSFFRWRRGVKEVLDYVLVRDKSNRVVVERKVLDFQYSQKHFLRKLSDHYALEARIDLFSEKKIRNN